MIDFKSLGVRQLGSIYEGLAEFKLRVVSDKMAVVKGKKTGEIILYREAKNQRVRATIAKGAMYLENDKRERKATGSYYTADYIGNAILLWATAVAFWIDTNIPPRSINLWQFYWIRRRKNPHWTDSAPNRNPSNSHAAGVFCHRSVRML